MFDYRIAGRVLHVVVGAEPEVVVLLLRRGVHPPTLVAGERALLVVGRDDVLPQLGPNLFEQVPSVSEEGEVAQQCVLALEEVPCGDDPQRRGGCGGDGTNDPAHAVSVSPAATARNRLATHPDGNARRPWGALSHPRPSSGGGGWPPSASWVVAASCRFNTVINVCPNRHMGNSSNSDGMADTLNNEERAEWNIRMNTILYFSPNGVVFETRAYTKADIAQLVHDQGLQCLTSADRQFDFWFTPSTRRCQRRANQSATELLLATTTFTAKTVPMLRGCVVVATHDADGDLDGLSWQQLDLLVRRSRSLTKRDERVLSRRIVRGDRRQRRNAEAAQATPFAARDRARL